MARKKKHEEHENHERWLVSYADFITLLFAFFVVMYSVSSVNEGKYRVLSDALVAAFRAPAKSMLPIQIGDAAKSPAGVEFSVRNSPAVIKTFDRPLPSPDSKEGQKEKEAQLKRDNKAQEKTQTASEAAAAIQKMADNIEHAMQNLIKEDLISVRRSTFWLEVEINTSILYSSGDARLAPDAVPVLEELAKILTPFPNALHVEGFTDNVPINTLVFPSNWELSAARAASVVTLFAKSGIKPERMAAIGYGEFRPVSDNDTVEGRTKNRRVKIVVLSAAAKHEMPQKAESKQLDQKLSSPAKVDVVTDSAAEAPIVSHASTPATTAGLPPTTPSSPTPALTPVVSPVVNLPHMIGEPKDVTSQDHTDIGRFPVIDLPIAVPLPGRPAALPPAPEPVVNPPSAPILAPE